MKRTAFILTLCILASLASCGKDDETTESKPLNIQKATISTTENLEDEEITTDEIESTIESSKKTTKPVRVTTVSTAESDTTTKTGTASIAKRTTVSAPKVSPNRGNGRIPTVSNTKRTTVTTTQTTTTTAKPHFGFRNGDISCLIRENGIEVSQKDKKNQFIEIDTSGMIEYYQTEDYHNGKAKKSALINIVDFDFDGYSDLYIPQFIGTPNNFGIYMHYNPDTEKFESWEELSDIKLYFNINEDKTLTSHCYISAVEYEQKTYKWNDEKKLEIIRLKRQYRPEDSEDVFIDYFDYPDGEETLVRREKLILDDENNIIDTEEIPLNQEETTTTTETTITTTETTTTETTTTETTTEVTDEE
ncbi:MAG: hypothetical protein K2K91_11690 [Ruminococcus sp.]|nr:hypothetical protein [Ruminococcus sp.]